ncbi:AAA family ATPase [[Mycoplasma] gypis]|uniref:AAA family ATPase n=1 Tax=[Mycoplasma] gypis TaxID=92404 RepID=A0ABZ2RMY5_9BACT|nr:AAA family ATPase [[Mycoplasma] gypis]MBN0919524.1 AAA family ATPase [[Mycoplasma] gypis]
MATILKGKFNKDIYTSTDGKFRLTSFSVSEQIETEADFELSKFKTISVRTEFKQIEFNEVYKLELIHLNNPKYKHTYAIARMEKTNEVDTSFILKFLSSPAYKGIGQAKAKKIIEKYGNSILDKIKAKEVTHEDLNIGESTFKSLQNDLINNELSSKLRIFIYECGLSDNFYSRLLFHCKPIDFFEIYAKKPWQLYFNIENARFSDIEKIAKKLGRLDDFDYNIVLIYDLLLDYLYSSGNTRILANNLFLLVKSKYKDYQREIFDQAIKKLIDEDLIVPIKHGVILIVSPRSIFDQEKFIVQRLKFLKENANRNRLKYESIKLDEVQVNAVIQAVNNPLTMITGAPGTGKTLVTNEIIRQLMKKYDEKDIVVATPTGRATININRLNLVKATTIHSLLKWDTDTKRFKVNEHNMLDAKVLIVDEFSMVPTSLFYHLLKALNKYDLQKIILVGDKDQLPAIGPGYLIHDFIANEIFDVVYLHKNYRQGSNYAIVSDAQEINKNVVPEFKGESSQFIETNKEVLALSIVEKVSQLVEQGYTKKQIAILSPIYNYQTGIDNINETLQTYWGALEKAKEHNVNGRRVFLNDKVINLENDTNKNIFNGEIGYVEKISYSQSGEKGKILYVFVTFDDGKTIAYTPSEFNNKTMLAYCTSVHKYQGSESEIVLTVLFSEAKFLLSKKLIYTAITRAKNLSIIYGEREALEYGISNDRDSKRATSIKTLWTKINN